MLNLKRLMIALAVVVSLIIVAGASAKTGDNPTPTCPAPYRFDPATASCKDPNATQVTVTATLMGVSATSHDVDTGKVTILGYINAKGMPKALVRKLAAQGKCRWIGRGTNVPVFTNSGARSGYGPYGKFKDTRRTYTCHTGKGPTGWQKVYDINPDTGQKENHCDNYLWFFLSSPLIQGRVIMVRNLANVKIHLHAQAQVTVTNANCPGSSASASGSADVTVSLSMYIRSRGSVRSDVSGSATGKATAKAAASVTCGPAAPAQVTFEKLLLDANGTDITSAHKGGLVPLSVSIVRNGSVVQPLAMILPEVQLGVPFSLPGVQLGDTATFCVPSDYSTHENDGMFDPFTGKIDLCASTTVTSGLNKIYDRIKPTTTPTPTPTPTAPSVKITLYPSLNQIPAGQPSGQLSITANASGPGGELTIDPGIGKVATCTGGQEASHVFSLNTGDNTFCYYLYAPNDASKPSTMTVTYTATLGNASDQKIDKPTITYSTRGG